MHFCHCHAIDLCFPACFYSGECSIPPVLLQCVWTVFMPSSDPPLTLQTRPDPIRHPLHPTPKRIGLLLCLFSSRLVSSIFLFLSYCPFFMSSTSLFLFLLSLSCWFAQVLHSFEELKAHRSLISFHDELSEARQVMKLAFSLMDIVTHHTHPKRPVCI